MKVKNERERVRNACKQLSTLGIFNFYYSYHLPDFFIQLWLLLCIPSLSLSLSGSLANPLSAFFIGSVAGSLAKLSILLSSVSSDSRLAASSSGYQLQT